MAKFVQKIKARKLREQGKSIKQIAKLLAVSKSSASIWCRDMILSPKQIQILEQRRTTGGYAGRLKGARMQHEHRLEETKKLEAQGKRLVRHLTGQEMLLLGIALYWGEGSKKEGRVRICNSDPRLITFMLRWFQDVWKIPKKDITANIIINKTHELRIQEVERYWSRILGIPIGQFTKTILIQAKNKKIYQNYSKHHGTLTLTVRRSTNLRHIINGVIGAIDEILASA